MRMMFSLRIDMYTNPVLLPCCMQIGILVCCRPYIQAEYRSGNLWRGKVVKVFSVLLVSV